MVQLFSQNDVKKNMQILNCAALALGAYCFISDPEKPLSEYGLDMAVHLFTIISFGQRANFFNTFPVAAANMFRMGDIFGRVTSGGSNIPLALNLVDALVHFINGPMILLADDSPKPVHVGVRPK